jgi:hypothetical protein
MACRKCESSWVTPCGRDMASCPECCKQQRCKARKEGRLAPAPKSINKSCADCGNDYSVSWQYGKKSVRCPSCRRLRSQKLREPERAKRRRMLRTVASFVSEVMVAIHAQSTASALAMCRTRNHPRLCVVCAKPFVREKRSNSVTCCGACSKKVVLQRSCAVCGGSVPVRLSGRNAKARRIRAECKQCMSRKWRKRCNGNRKGNDHRKRCRKFGVPYDPSVKPVLVYQRDGYVCHVCNRKTLMVFATIGSSPHPRSPTVDHHPYPLSVGVMGHVWENVRCACWECNTKKGASWDKQLPLMPLPSR